MAFEIKVSNLQLSNFLQYEKLIANFKPASVSALALDSYLVYHKGSEYLEFAIKDSTGKAVIKLNGSIEISGDIGEVSAFSIPCKKLFFVFSNYAETQDMILAIGSNANNSPYVAITTPTDTISLPTSLVSEEEINIVIYSNPEEKATALYTGSNNDTDLIYSMISCLDYIGNDDRKNNAVAVYPDHVMTNDRRHIYIRNLKDPTLLADQLFSSATPSAIPDIFIYKNIIKVFEYLKAKIDYSWSLNPSVTRVSFFNDTMRCEMNNNMSNLKPPSEEILAKIKSPILTTSVTAKVLYDIIKMFDGFKDIKNDWHPLTITTLADGLEFAIKNTGDNQFSTCNVTRKLLCATNPDNIGVSETIIIDSLLDFLSPIKDSEELISIYDSADSKSFTLITVDRTVYLSKLEE